MKDIAEHVGVSRQLVSLVLRGAEGPSARSRERVLAAAAELGYRPNASARLLRQGSTRTLGIVFSLHNSFQADVVERLFARVAARGYRLATAPIGPGRSTETAVGELMEQRVEALAVFNPEPGIEVLEAARRLVPVVLLGEWADGSGLDTVHVDETAGLRRAVEHLHRLGHRDIAYLGGLGGRVGPDRAAAYRDAMGAAGLAAHVDVVASGFDEEAGAEAARTVLARPQRPTALVCGSDHAAAGALAVLSGAGVRVPEEISVVGFDDNHLAALSYHRLTTVHQDAEEMVEATVEILLARLAEAGASEASPPAVRADGTARGLGGEAVCAEPAPGSGGGAGVHVPRIVATSARLVVRDSTGPRAAGR
ncbi:LacI family transcriptional regulator [Brachybacterium saurashtrense]|uniref:LacI family transcriptional regulator n=2 Tax=Brachybacterium saurashtrense TaxID=556288 RepID=A0A345YTN8_9MICO|nr:LacI family transcriptional regulator [Brachybacterium saurashtrense]RRR24411.1 LacI family transcriptional regulator [Brachybacterium saurashtrense]